MRLATRSQSQEIDRRSTSEYLLSPEILMEAAGALAAREIEQSFLPELRKGSVVVVCGPGHNGADGLVVARHLHGSAPVTGQRDILVILVAPEHQQRELFQLQLDRAFKLGIRLVDWQASADAKTEAIASIERAALVVDALFGVGLSRPLESPFREAVDAINRSRRATVSLDVPTGLDVDTGRVFGAAIKADLTIGFGPAKPGYFTDQGPACVGRVRNLSIGFPRELVRDVATTHLAFTERLVRRYLPARVATTNKAKQGHLVIVAGSDGMAGAASLCALAASRVGVGYTTVCSSNADTQSLLRSVLGAAPGVLFPKESALEVISSQRATAYAIGPGLPADPVTVGLLQELRSQSRPVVVDAGALTAIAQAPAQRWPESWVMTPHLGELARLLKRSVAELETDRFTAAQEASRQLGSHCLLKGFRSVLGCRQRALLIMSGNAALAKAGTGDVLTGMIGGLLAQGVPSLQAAASAAFIHGRLADDWVRSGRDKRSLLPHDLTDHLPAMLKRLSLPSFETF